jgi:hypothetical protein
LRVSLDGVAYLNFDHPRVVVVFMKTINRPIALAVSVFLALLTAVVTTGTAIATPVVPAPDLLKVKAGNANFCLDRLAQKAFDADGISMSAGAPAQLVTTGPQPCATTHVTEGAVSLGLSDGSFPFRGTITFARASEDARITFSDISVTFGVPSTVTAVVDGNTKNPITLLKFTPLPGNIMTDGTYLIAHDVPLNLTDEGANALTTTFGRSPVSRGKPLFVGTGYGELEAGGLPLPGVFG